MTIELKWITSERGAVKTAFYRPANLTIKVKSAKASDYTRAHWEAWHNGKWEHDDYNFTMSQCQQEASEWIATRAAHALWDSEWLRSKIVPYLQGCPLAILEYGWQAKLGEYCNSPAEVVEHQPCIDEHKARLRAEWQRLNLIEARAFGITSYGNDNQKIVALHILGRDENA